jgi:hypothetical protein
MLSLRASKTLNFQQTKDNLSSLLVMMFFNWDPRSNTERQEKIQAFVAKSKLEAQQQRPEKRPTIRNNPAVTPKPGIGKLPTPREATMKHFRNIMFGYKIAIYLLFNSSMMQIMIFLLMMNFLKM